MKKNAIVVLAVVLAAVALVVVWRHTRTQPANAVATKPVTSPAAAVATTSRQPSPASAAPSPTSPLATSGAVTAAPAAAPLPAPMPAVPPIAAAPAPEPTVPATEPTPTTSATTAAVQTAPALPHIDEVTATRRMILAHAPLRDPKVADPDSVENRQVLETMVAKALARAAAEKKP